MSSLLFTFSAGDISEGTANVQPYTTGQASKAFKYSLPFVLLAEPGEGGTGGVTGGVGTGEKGGALRPQLPEMSTF